MSTQEKLLIKLNGLFFFSVSLAGVFLNLFLFQFGGFKSVVLYNLVALAFLYLIYLSSGYLLTKLSSRLMIQIGFFFFILLYTFLFIFQENSVNHLIVIGLLNGIANGFYWVGNNLTQYIETHELTRSDYFGRLNFLLNLGSAFGPLTGGIIIYCFNTFSLELAGYITVFGIVGILFVLLFLLSKKLPDYSGVKFSFKHIFIHKRSFNWKIVLSQQFMYGLYDVSLGTFVPILIFIFIPQEFTVGAISTLSILTIAFANLLATKILKKNRYSYIYATIFVPIGILIFALQQNWLGVLSLIFISNTTQPLLTITTSKSYYDTIDEANKPWQEKYHYLIERDTILGTARLLVYSFLLIIFTTDNQAAVARTWIMIIPIFPLTIGLLQLYKDIYNKKVI